MKLIVLLVVVLSSTSSAVPSDKVTLYVTSPHEVWLNVSHDITSEVSLLSNTLITGRVGGPVRSEAVKVYKQNVQIDFKPGM